jgi:hypothetical protein
MSMAETFASHFYSEAFCAPCGSHFPVDQFVWEDSTERVGS